MLKYDYLPGVLKYLVTNLSLEEGIAFAVKRVNEEYLIFAVVF